MWFNENEMVISIYSLYAMLTFTNFFKDFHFKLIKLRSVSEWVNQVNLIQFEFGTPEQRNIKHISTAHHVFILCSTLICSIHSVMHIIVASNIIQSKKFRMERVSILSHM